ncbi:MAG TPA: AAA family ATPase, partial [Acidimicrobiales bacterium]
MSLRRLQLTDFRIFPYACFTPEREGTTVITGANGTGKTSVLEALAYLGSRRSFRGAPPEAMVRGGAESAIVRAEIEGADSPVTVEAELRPAGRSRTQVNHKVKTARKDLAAAAPCTVFSPDDLALVSGAPRGRRELLDDALGALDGRGARAADDVERVLRQRGALLRQAAGRATPEIDASLDVWDQRLAEAGATLVSAREALTAALAELVGVAYAGLACAVGEDLVS